MSNRRILRKLSRQCPQCSGRGYTWHHRSQPNSWQRQANHCPACDGSGLFKDYLARLLSGDFHPGDEIPF